MSNHKPVEWALREALEEVMAYLDCRSHVVCPQCKENFTVYANGVTEPTLKKLRESVEAALSAAPAPTAIPTVDEIAEATADARLWKGSWMNMCEAERNVMRQGAAGVYSLLERRAAKEQADGQSSAGTTGGGE